MPRPQLWLPCWCCCVSNKSFPTCFVSWSKKFLGSSYSGKLSPPPWRREPGAGLHLITSRLCLIRSNWAIVSQQRQRPPCILPGKQIWMNGSQYILYSAPEVWVVWSPGSGYSRQTPQLHLTSTQHSTLAVLQPSQFCSWLLNWWWEYYLYTGVIFRPIIVPGAIFPSLMESPHFPCNIVCEWS